MKIQGKIEEKVKIKVRPLFQEKLLNFDVYENYLGLQYKSEIFIYDLEKEKIDKKYDI